MNTPVETDAAPRDRSAVSYAVTAVIVIYTIAALVQMFARPDQFQVNFRVYYYGAMAYNQGLNLYDSDVTYRLAGDTYVLPYVYPPFTVHLFRPLALLDYTTAARVFLFCKCLLLAGLLWLWHAKFLRSGVDNFFLGICLIGFNFCIFWDLQAGNVNLIETAMLWLGFYAFIQNRLMLFAACVVTAASFKLTPIVFLAVPLLSADKHRWRTVFFGGALFAAVQGTSALLYPQLTKDFFAILTRVQGIVTASGDGADRVYVGAPATWALISAFTVKVGDKLGIAIPAFVPLSCFALFILAVCAAVVFTIRSATFDSDLQRRIWIVVIACLVYIVLSPRHLVYSYVIAILPAYYVVREARRIPAALALLALMTVSTIPGHPPGFKLLLEFLPQYYPLLVAYAVLALAVVHLWDSGHRMAVFVVQAESKPVAKG